MFNTGRKKKFEIDGDGDGWARDGLLGDTEFSRTWSMPLVEFVVG